MDLKGRFWGILKKRFHSKTLLTLLATASIIQYFDLTSRVSGWVGLSPDSIFTVVFITGTIFQFLKSIVEYVFSDGFG